MRERGQNRCSPTWRLRAPEPESPRPQPLTVGCARYCCPTFSSNIVPLSNFTLFFSDVTTDPCAPLAAVVCPLIGGCALLALGESVAPPVAAGDDVGGGAAAPELPAPRAPPPD